MRVRHVEIKVKQYADGRYGFDDYSSGRLKKVRLKTKTKADNRAIDIAVYLANGRTDLLGIDRGTLARFREWEEQRNKGINVHDGVAKFIKSKEADKHLNRQYLRTLTFCANLLDEHLGKMTVAEANDIRVIDELLSSLGKAPVRHNSIRDSFVTIFRYWRDHGHLPDGETTAPERLKRLKVARKVEITSWSPEEAEFILSTAPLETLAYHAVGLFAGIREYERMAKPCLRADTLDWSDFNWRDKIIHIRPEVSKTGFARNVPILPALRSWLAPVIQKSGPIGKFDRTRERDRIESTIGLRHRSNAHRHTFGIYRTTITRNVHQVSQEMGNTPQIVQARYYRPRPMREATAFFGLRIPKDSKIVPFRSKNKRSSIAISDIR